MSDILLRLDESSLRRDPLDVFDVLEKLGEGSYGSVVKAMHKATGKIVAIKQVPVESDLQEIIKEISMMQQCNWPNVVQYFGSYFKNSDLWIIMEYCGAGSVADIMRLRRKTMTEPQTACIIADTLRGLEYLHSKRKIHRDIKAGNILLTKEGLAKLADFGVAGQLSDTMAKRNTVIGTPYWMAPEVIQEVGYDSLADVWSLGITVIELCEGKPPHSAVHPMRAIFMIPTSPAPRLAKPELWSSELSDFLSQCLVKRPEERAAAAVLMKHPFVRNAKKPGVVLTEAIQEAAEILRLGGGDDDGDDGEGGMGGDAGTLVGGGGRAPSLDDAVDSGTAVFHEPVDAGTMIVTPGTDGAMGTTNFKAGDASGTGVLASSGSNAGSMLNAGGVDPGYKPAFMQHFENHPGTDPTAVPAALPDSLSNISHLRDMSVDDLRRRLRELQPEMDKEIADLRARYQAKRAPILAAMAAKKSAT